jgi:hypothetical protein
MMMISTQAQIESLAVAVKEFGRDIVICPACGNQSIIKTEIEVDIPFALSARGITVNVCCDNGHIWQLRISSWFLEERYAKQTAEKLRTKKWPSLPESQTKRGPITIEIPVQRQQKAKPPKAAASQEFNWGRK